MGRTRQELPILDPVGLPDSARFILWAEPGTDFWAGVGDADSFGEAPDQILEGREYEFALPDGCIFADAGGEPIVLRSDAHPCGGTIRTGNYVGRFVREIVREGTAGPPVGRVELEVRSIKMDYRTHYRSMLKDIAERATELVMSKNRFAQQSFRPDVSEPAKTLYERFAFVKALVEGEGFDLAVAKIVSNPLLGRTEDREESSIRRPGLLSGGMVRQLATGGNRIAVPAGSPLRRVADSLPARIRRPCLRETADIPENRFVKYVLQSFLDFADEMEARGAATADGEALRREAHTLGETLETRLSDPFFRELSPLRAIPLSSPALQRREGYREILRAWLFFDAAASLAWSGGDDVYAGGKRNVAQLYEYWLFFKMLDWVCDAFDVRPKGGLESLLQPVPGTGRLELALRSGRHSPVDAVSTLGPRPIHVRFSYNRTFGRRKGLADAGSWSLRMRPDYTLSLWPEDIGETEAERLGLAVHLHFDAKYRKRTLREILDVDDPDLPEDGDWESMSEEDRNRESEKENRRKAEEDAGVCKRADLLKMHAYNDAIRRTYGSYVLYPGESDDQRIPLRRYHEIIPGLGAFCVRPPDGGTGGGSAPAVLDFLRDIQREMQKRTTQRERSAVHRHRDVLEPPASLTVVRDDPPLPEWEDGTGSRPFVPADVNVLVGVYKSKTHLAWIEGVNGWGAPRYNIRLDSGRGSLEELGDALSARYLLLHGDDSKTRTTLLFKLNPGLPPEYVTKADLVAKGYPSPGHDRYLLLQPLRPPDELKGLAFDPQKLIGARDPHLPFVVTFEDILRARCG